MPPVSVPNDAVLKPGSLVLITGVTGYIGAHIADQLLQRGYKVRGVVRRPSDWITSLFNERYGEGLFTTYFVPDLSQEELLVPAMKDVHGVVHVASDVSFSPDPAVVIPIAVNLATAALKAAAQTPSVQRFVFTSSSSAASEYAPDVPRTVTATSWCDAWIAESRQPGPYGPERGLSTYAASKALAEQTIWKWAQDNKDGGMTVNTVLPDYNAGLPVSPEHQGWPSTAGISKALFDGNAQMGRAIPPQHFVAVGDVARLHVAALLRPDVVSERVFAYAEPKNSNVVLAIFRELYPDRKFIEDDPNEGRDLAVIEQKDRAEELLRWVAGKGWTGMKESFKEMGDYWIEHEKKQ